MIGLTYVHVQTCSPQTDSKRAVTHSTQTSTTRIETSLKLLAFVSAQWTLFRDIYICAVTVKAENRNKVHNTWKNRCMNINHYTSMKMSNVMLFFSITHNIQFTYTHKCIYTTHAVEITAYTGVVAEPAVSNV